MRTNYFEDIIGQERAVSHLNKLCNAISEREIPMQPIALLGHAGLGKNFLAERIVPAFEDATGKEWELVEISCSISLPAFINVWTDKIEDKNAVIFIDEFHGLKNFKLINLIKRLTETNNRVKEVSQGDDTLTSNPFTHLWVVATDRDMKDSALIGPTARFKTLQLVSYTEEEISYLICYMSGIYGFTFGEGVIDFLSTRVKKNARAVKQLVDDLLLSCETFVTLDSAKTLVVETQRFPRGLSISDVKTLMFLGSDSNGKQVSEIAAHCDGEDPSICSYRLRELAGEGMIATQSGKKFLTRVGKNYLHTLQSQQK